MVNRVLYLYRAYHKNFDGILEHDLLGVYHRKGTNLVAIDLNSVVDNTLRQRIVKEYSLRDFEIEQEKFISLIKLLPQLNAYLTSIEVSKRYEDEYREELFEVIESQNFDATCSLIKNYWDLGADIQSVEFFWDGSRIRFTRLAELDLSANNPDIANILNTKPIGILAGVVRGD